MPVLPDDSDTISPSPAELHESACRKSGSFWHDKKNERLFNSLNAEDSFILWIETLKVAEFNASELKKLVNKSEAHPLTTHQAFAIQQKVMFLQCAYQYVLKDMPDKVSWQACCEQSIKFWKTVVGIKNLLDTPTVETVHNPIRVRIDAYVQCTCCRSLVGVVHNVHRIHNPTQWHTRDALT